MNYYLIDTSSKKKPDNFYPQHFYVMQEIAKDYGIEFNEGLPQVKEKTTLFQGNSKLVLDDQWASHPSTEDRVNRLQDLNIPQKSHRTNLSCHMFKEIKHWEMVFTELNFSSNQEENARQDNNLVQFKAAIQEKKVQYQFPDLFKNYFDNRNLPALNLETLVPLKGKEQSLQVHDLFNETIQAKIKNLLGIQNDLHLISQIASGDLQQRTFDYDGQKYRKKDATTLQVKLQAQFDELKKELEAHDLLVFKYHYQLAQKKGLVDTFKASYQSFGQHDQQYLERMQLLQKMREATYFMQVQISRDEIRHYFKELRPVEAAFKSKLKSMLNEEDYSKVMTTEIREQLEMYSGQSWRYFTYPNYNPESLNMLYHGMYYFEWLLNEAYFQKKRAFLYFLEQLNQ